MASKPSLPAALLRTYTSLLGRRTSQLQSHATRYLGLEVQEQVKDTWRRHVEGTGWLQGIPVGAQNGGVGFGQGTGIGAGQRRWKSNGFLKQRQTKVYGFDDVCFLDTRSRLSANHHPPRSYPSSKHPQTRASLSTSASPTNTPKTAYPPLSISPSDHSPMRCSSAKKSSRTNLASQNHR